MKASIVYKSLDTSIVGPASSKVALIKEIDLGKVGIFVLEFSRMIQFPIKSYGKIKKSYAIEAWEYDSEGFPILVKELHFKNKREAVQALKEFSL